MTLERTEQAITVVKRLDRWYTTAVTLLLLILGAFTVSTWYDLLTFTATGIHQAEDHDFAALAAVNGDIAAWLTLDGTKIDHPVVQGDDNFEYLDKNFQGNDYAGGCLFFDVACSKDLGEAYLIIHGHHMAYGAMFGDLSKYCDAAFFEEHSTGRLLTPDSVYDLTVAGVDTVDAYDAAVYYTAPDRAAPLELLEGCDRVRQLDFADGDKLLLLSTCAGTMTNDRTAVYCRMRYAGENKE